jgi:hypothetical protein
MAVVAVAASHPSAEATSEIAAVRAYWEKLGSGAMPTKRAFDFMQVYKQAPHLLMAERTAPGAFKFIYCGTLIADNFPLDLTGKSYAPDTPRVSKIPWPRLFASALDVPCVGFGEMPVDWPGAKFAYARFGVFPLSDDSGAARYALACLVFGGARDGK